MYPDGNRIQVVNTFRHWDTRPCILRVLPVSARNNIAMYDMCMHVCSLLLGSPNFKDPYLLAQVV